jgi:hypothetical protein
MYLYSKYYMEQILVYQFATNINEGIHVKLDESRDALNPLSLSPLRGCQYTAPLGIRASGSAHQGAGKGQHLMGEAHGQLYITRDYRK